MTIGLRLTDRSITLRNGACPYLPTGPADTHHLDAGTSQTGPQEPLTVAHPREAVDHHQLAYLHTHWAICALMTPSELTLSDGEVASLIDGLTDDVSFEWTLIDLGIRSNPPPVDEPPDA